MSDMQTEELAQYYEMVRHQHVVRNDIFKWYMSISVFVYTVFGYVVIDSAQTSTGLRLASGILLFLVAIVGVVTYRFIRRLYVIRDDYLDAIWRLKDDVYSEEAFAQTKRYLVLKKLEHREPPKVISTRFLFISLVLLNVFVSFLCIIYLVANSIR